MNSIVLEKSKKILEEMLDLFESLSLFVILRREEGAPWDWIFAANQLDKPENLKVVADLITKELDKNEITSISRIVLLNTDDQFAKNFTSSYSVGSGGNCMTIQDELINNVQIKQAFLFYSRG